MRRSFLLVAMLAVSALSCQTVAQSPCWTVRASACSATYLPGEPIYLALTIENNSGRSLAYPGLAGKFYLDAVDAPCLARDVPIATPPAAPPPGGTASQGEAKLEPSGTIHSELINIASWCNMTVGDRGLLGEHTVRFRPHSNSLSPPEITATFRIITAQGTDRDVYKKLPPSLRDIISDRSLVKVNLLREYPTTTYAAYVIYDQMKRFTAQDPAAVVGSLEGGTFNSNSYPDEIDQSKDGWKWLKGQAAADWWAKWYDVILKNHPDIWFADEMRLKKAVDQISVKNYQAAQADLEALSKDASFKQKDKAQAYLSLMKQKGWAK
jgi:hypothetical protein